MIRHPATRLVAIALCGVFTTSVRAQPATDIVVPSIETIEATSATAPPAAAASVDLFSPDTVVLSEREQRSADLSQEFIEHSDDLATLADGGTVVVRYGASIPTLVCAPLHICDIVLEPGEVVNGIDSGDTVRWLLTPSVSGTGADAQTHVVVKPLDVGLTTNVLIATDRRSYRLKLVSTANRAMTSISFSYPPTAASARAQWDAYRGHAALVTPPTAGTEPASVGALDFAYRLTGDTPAWTPSRVYTDGAQTVVELPAGTAAGDMPVLLVLDANGDSQMVNYRVIGTRIVIDRVVDHAMLVVGTGRKQVRVTIRRSGVTS